MRILIITDEVWNDKRYSNNVLTNWFKGFPAEFANIYLASGIPDNPCCKRYFQITDTMMLKSIFTGEAAGRGTIVEDSEWNSPEEDLLFYDKWRPFATEALRFMRDLLWQHGRFNREKIMEFIREFQPDIIFCPRMASRKMLRFERLLKEWTQLPMVAFTGDDEYTLSQIRISPIYWLRRAKLRKEFRNAVGLYQKYYTLSMRQTVLYRKRFHLDTDVLLKCADPEENLPEKEFHIPIRMIYAGRLYCNRWQTLVKIKKALEEINRDSMKMILEIYTRDKVTAKRRKALEDGVNSFVKPPVDANQLKDIYRQGEIALFVESFDLKNKLLTKFSFSTKIIDCLASSCAVVAVCPRMHPGYAYLKERDAAICITNPGRIHPVLKKLAGDNDIIRRYQRKAGKCVHSYHRRSVVQAKLYRDFMRIIRENAEKLPIL